MKSPHSTNPTSNISPSAVSNNPFILGNIALLAGIPWLLTLSMAGLAVGDPVFPAWFEIFLLGIPAIAFVAWLQWQQPFSPFSLWFVSKPTESLSDRDRQVLTLVKQHSNGWYVTGWIATAVAIAISAIFCKMYIAAPLAQTIAPFPAGLRLFGIVWAEIFFLLSNVLLQAGVSALRIKLTAESELNSMKPFAVEKIKNSFTNIGWQSPQLLKFFEEDAIADTTESAIKEPVEIVSETDVAVMEPSNTTSNTTSNTILETEPEEIISELQIETSQEIIQESEELEPIEFIAEHEAESFSETYIISELEEPTPLETETILEVADISLTEQFVEEVEELEISAIVAEESVVESNSEPEIEQLIEEPQIEALSDTILDQVIIRESGDLNFIDVSEDAETLLAVTGTTETELDEPEIVEAETILEVFDIGKDELFFEEVEDSGSTANIFEKNEELETFEISEKPEMAFLDIPNTSLESKIENQPQLESDLGSSEPALEEQITEESDGLEFIETVENSKAEDFSNTTLTSAEKGGLDFLKKSCKTGAPPKKLGFGKSMKRDHSVVSIPETIDPEELELVKSPNQKNAIANNEFDTANLDAIATPIEQDLEAPAIKTQDFDDELDELIAFNAYVENILKEYLEGSEDTEAIAEVDEIAEPTAISEQALVEKKSLDEEVSEPIDPSIVFDPAIEAIAIAKDNVETFAENLSELEPKVPEDRIEEATTDINDQETKDSQYLVQELLVDKFLARLEELNIADKANKLSIEKAKENTSELNPEIDEFADLEALLDRKPLSSNLNLGDLSDRNS